MTPVQLIPLAFVWYVYKRLVLNFKLFVETIMCLVFFLLQVCKNYTRAYIHCLVTKDAMGSQLLSYHNLYYMMQVQIISCNKMIYYKYMVIILMLWLKLPSFKILQLSRNLHSSIVEERFPKYVLPLYSVIIFSTFILLILSTNLLLLNMPITIYSFGFWRFVCDFLHQMVCFRNFINLPWILGTITLTSA